MNTAKFSTEDTVLVIFNYLIIVFVCLFLKKSLSAAVRNTDKLFPQDTETDCLCHVQENHGKEMY